MDCLALSTFVSTRLAQKQLIVSMSIGLMFNGRNYIASIVGAHRMNSLKLQLLMQLIFTESIAQPSKRNAILLEAHQAKNR